MCRPKLFFASVRVSQALFARARAPSPLASAAARQGRPLPNRFARSPGRSERRTTNARARQLASLECALCVRCSRPVPTSRKGSASLQRPGRRVPGRVDRRHRQGRRSARPLTRIVGLRAWRAGLPAKLLSSARAWVTKLIWRVPQSLAMSPSRQKEQSLELSAVAGFPARVQNDRLLFKEKDDERAPGRVHHHARFARGALFPGCPHQSAKASSLFREKDDEPSWPRQPHECLSVPARVVRRPRQGRAPAPPGRRSSFQQEASFASGPARVPARVACKAGECQSCAVPAKVARQTSQPHCLGSFGVRCEPSAPGRSWAPPQGRPPSPPGWPANSFCECRFPARVARRPRQGHPPSLGPARVLALGDKGTQFYYCAPWLAVPNQVWQTRSAWQSKQISKR